MRQKWFSVTFAGLQEEMLGRGAAGERPLLPQPVLQVSFSKRIEKRKRRAIFLKILFIRCKGCSRSLAQGGFFSKGKDYFCAKCYQAHFGTKCAGCGLFVEGEVVTALGKTYHQVFTLIVN